MSVAGALDAVKPKAPRILTIDIETSPNVAYVWGLWDVNVSLTQLIEPSRVLCFAAKWVDEKKVHFFSEYHDGKQAMVQAAWDIMNEADIIVGYNHARFDIPHLHREFLLAGMNAPSPHQDIDLLRVMKNRFKFISNKLGYVTDALGMDTKLETGGQQLWNNVLKNDPKAWAKFRRYNIQDVRITEQLFQLLSPWIKNVPHAGMWSDNMAACFSCGGTNLTPVGFVFERTAVFPKVLCACGAWCKVLKNGQTRGV
jgi:DNA polymerase elongation subunit (family B)